MIYQVAEIFHSMQGEGTFIGQPMLFARLAGCNVGKYNTNDGLDKMQKLADMTDFPLYLSQKHSICTSIDGQQFLCDTDYHKTVALSEHAIAQEAEKENVVCVTGGEPFIWNLQPLADALEHAGKKMHIETSGTLLFTPALNEETLSGYVWITCSPKAGFQKANAGWIDEWKFVVGPQTDFSTIRRFLDEMEVSCATPIYLQPVNPVGSVDKEAVLRVLDLALRHSEPEGREFYVSVQLHKLLGLR